MRSTHEWGDIIATMPDARPERCPRCGRAAFIPWTLRRDDQTKVVMRTWVCTECQITEERPEPE